MRTSIIFLLLFSIFGCQDTPQTSSNVLSQDVQNFWEAYDAIAATGDTTQQQKLLKELFLDKASEGQQAMIAARNYTEQEYLAAIHNYPKFWESVRPNTQKAHQIADDLEKGIQKLKDIYPELKPARIYFTIGALRSNGTTLDSMVLIGTELAFGDSATNVEEFPEQLSHLPGFFETNPKDNLVFLNTHEYIHTQQKSTIGNNILAQTVLEGVAEYLTEIALNTASPNPQIEYGRKNDDRIKKAFVQEIFSPILYNWIWNSPNNEFGMRDLAYYIGYKISEGYYQQATDKSAAIKEMIELDYNNENDLMKFVNAANYFEKPVEILKKSFEESRPTVINVLEIKNANRQISHEIKKLSVEFSEPMDVQRISTDLGELGLEHFPKLSKAEFSEDGKFLYYFLTLEPNKKYEMLLHWNMRNQNGIPLVPYNLKFETK